MARFIRLYDSDNNAKYACSNGKVYKAIEIIDNPELYDLYGESEIRQLFVDASGEKRFVNSMEIVTNPNYADEHPELFPAAYDEAFNTLWEMSESLYERV